MHQENEFELISVSITITLTLLIIFVINLKSVIGNCFGDQFLGRVKEICLSPGPLRLGVPPFGITLTLQKLHLHS